MIRKIIPSSVKPVLRLLRYPWERKRFVREIRIKKIQDKLIKKQYNNEAENLIVFMIIGIDKKNGKEEVSGGVLSIVSICEETRKLKSIHNSETIMCTMKDEGLLTKHLLFDNNVDVFRFRQLYTYFINVKRIIIHIPEMMVHHFIESSSPTFKKWLKQSEFVHINILNQHVKLMPGREEVELLKKMANKITATTAHQKYCTADFSNHYGIPVHKFSTFIAPEQYHYRSFSEKKNLIIVSPDPNPYRERVLEKIKLIEGLEVVVIQNMTYNHFKEIISLAKWSLTFGEGLDGYLVEPVFSGAVGFAVYNEEFFTPDFEELETIYDSYETMIDRIVKDIARLNNADIFKQCQQKQLDICSYHYSHQEYQNNVANFYRHNYTHQYTEQ